MLEIQDRKSCRYSDSDILKDKSLQRRMMEGLLLVRRFEEKVLEFLDQGLIYGTTHLAIGEEAACIGSTLALAPLDYMMATHRGHGQSIGKGCDINALMAELLGRATGICGGRGGSMHLADFDKGVLGTNGIVGANAPLACGAALSCKMKKQERICAVFFGDGAANEGAVHEAMNLAAAWSLPIVFCLVNNQYGMSMPLDKAMRETDLTKRADAYGMKSLSCDGNDVLQVYEAVREARGHALKDGPVLVVEHTYRTCGHSKSDGNFYRSQEEIDAWSVNNPTERFKHFLTQNGLFTQNELAIMEESVFDKVKKAAEFAISSPYPHIDTAHAGVYA